LPAEWDTQKERFGSEQLDFAVGPVTDFGRDAQLPPAYTHRHPVPAEASANFLICADVQQLFLGPGPRPVQKTHRGKAPQLTAMPDG